VKFLVLRIAHDVMPLSSWSCFLRVDQEQFSLRFSHCLYKQLLECPRFGTEVRICPVSGLSTLQVGNVCEVVFCVSCM